MSERKEKINEVIELLREAAEKVKHIPATERVKTSGIEVMLYSLIARVESLDEE